MENALNLSERLDQPCTDGVETRIHRCVLHCVEHPDVFCPETAIAQRIFNALTGPPFYLRVFWDRVCIPMGVDWKCCFATIASRAAVFVPLLSYDGVVRRIIRRTLDQRPDNESDNVLLERVISFACHDDGAKRRVPLCIGDNTPGYPWSAFAFNPDVSAASTLPNPQEITTLHVRHAATASAARNLLAYIQPSAAQKTDAAVADLWNWFSTKQAYVFTDLQLEAATTAHQADLHQLEDAKYSEICVKIKSASSAVSRPPIQPCSQTRGGCLTILNRDLGIIAGFAVGTAALLQLCSRMNFGALITNVRAGSVVIHFRLTITTKSTMAVCQGYDQLKAWYDDGSLELELGLGQIRFDLEVCVDDSMLMLCHRLRCNSESLLKVHSASPPALAADEKSRKPCSDIGKPRKKKEDRTGWAVDPVDALAGTAADLALAPRSIEALELAIESQEQKLLSMKLSCSRSWLPHAARRLLLTAISSASDASFSYPIPPRL